MSGIFFDPIFLEYMLGKFQSDETYTVKPPFKRIALPVR